MIESTTQTAPSTTQEIQVQPDIVLMSISDSDTYELFSGDRFKSLEELQDWLFYPLLRQIIDGARAELLNKSEAENEL